MTVYFSNYDDVNRKQFLGLTFLYLDNFLGEYNVTMRVGEIKTLPASAPVTETRQPITDIAATFERLTKAKTN